jgi:NADH-quinone oxidoreductase subunit L
MKIPLIVLALLSLFGGFFGIPQFLLGENAHPMHLEMTVALTSSLVAIGGIALGSVLYARLRSKEDPLKKFFGAVYEFAVRKYYLDDLFLAISGFFQKILAKILFWFDWNIVIQKGVNGTAFVTSGVGSLLRRAQTGYAQTYAMVFAFGIVALVFFFMMGSF